MTSDVREVAIVQRRLTEYRVPLFELMRERLLDAGVRLRILHGSGTPAELRKRDGGAIPWAEPVASRYLLGDRICWLNFGPATSSSDLVIVTQENKLIYNLAALTVARPPLIAFWGHGRNFQARNPGALRERFKRSTHGLVDWWFAYNELSQRFVAEDGFPVDRITSLDNSIDTKALASHLASIDEAEVSAKRAILRLEGKRVALFLGSLHADKRLPFLIEAGALLAARFPDFALVVAGDGPERPVVEKAAESCRWLKYVGTCHGREKAVVLSLAEVMLNPGLVGLGILDAFVAGIPCITTECRLHSPEISYLVPGVNGLITFDSLDAFTSETARILEDGHARAGLCAEARASAQRYTIENMAQRFSTGVLSALEHGPLRDRRRRTP